MSRSARGFAVLCAAWVGLVPASAQVTISEFMASNRSTLEDDDGNFSDWIELWNTSTGAVNLAGWRLTDSAANPAKWVLPAVTLPPDGRLVVFASSEDRRNPAHPLHTNFKLDAGGEYLALVTPSGTVAKAYAPSYPPQAPDVSYGWVYGGVESVLLATGAAARVKAPAGPGLGLTWTGVGYDDSAWRAATNGIGFDSGLYNPEDDEGANAFAAVVGASAPAYWLRFSETSGTSFASLGTWALAAAGGEGGTVAVGLEGGRTPEWAGFEFDNRAVLYNGSTARLNTGQYTQFDFSSTGDFTFVVWFQPTEVTAGHDFFGRARSAGSSGGTNVIRFGIVSNALSFRHNGAVIGFGGTVVSGLWQQAVVTRSNGWVRGYLDAQPVFSGADTRSMTVGSGVRIGASRPGTGQAFTNYFLGRLDEFLVWSRALHPAEISNQLVAAQGRTPWFQPLLRTDVQADLLGVGAGLLARFPFVVTNALPFTGLELRLRYEDGFAAYLNGTPAAQGNALPSNEWNAVAQAVRTDQAATNWAAFTLTGALPALAAGTNVLAVHALNASVTNGDLFLEAQLLGSTLAPQPDTYLLSPTPAVANVAGVTNLGPVIQEVTDRPPQPTGDSNSPPVVVHATVLATLQPVAAVRLMYRYQFDVEQVVAMSPLTGDVWTASLPITNLGPGQMVRWRVEAVDAAGTTNREPLYLDPTNTPRYFGTVAADASFATALPVFHLFVDPTQLGAMDSESGARCAFFHDGEFYDNLYVELRGNTTAAYNKKSHRLEFNRGYGLRHPGPGGRIRKTSLMAEFADPSYLRQHLSFWLLDKMGSPAPFHYPVHVRRNGTFYQLAFHSDVLGEDQLERFGFDPDGALYKAAGTVVPSHFSTGGFIKKTREWEGTQDFDEMARAIAETNTPADRSVAAFDRFNLPEVINYLAVARFTQEGDDVWANMCLYRDSDGNREWSVIPFDQNVSWGQLYYGDEPSVYNVVNVTNDVYKSHPLYGGSQVRVNGGGNWNRVYDLVVGVPELRDMLLRRQRTLLDQWVQPSGTPAPALIFEAHIAGMTNQIGPDAQLDRTTWRWPPNSGMYGWGTNLWLVDGVTGLVNGFIAPRRDHFFITHSASNTARPVGVGNALNAGIPDPQPTNALIRFAGLEYGQAAATQATEYLVLTNPMPYAVDLSGWRLAGGVDFTFQPGTVLPTGRVLYVSPDVNAFRARTTPPSGGLGKFVQGPYAGQLSARGEALQLFDPAGRLVDQTSYAGAPSVWQQYLRVSELMYAPPNPSPAELGVDVQLLESDFEYIELVNIGLAPLDLAGVQLAAGVTHNFATGVVLAAGARVVVCAQTNAFRLRYGPAAAVAGVYTGFLDNAGERVQLLDPTGEVVLDFTYDDAWYPVTDGLGFALVARDEQQEWTAWDRAAGWRASAAAQGSPGAVEPAAPVFPPVLVNEVLAHTDPPLQDAIELFNAGATEADIGGWLLTDDRDTPRKYRIPTGTVVAAQGYVLFDAAVFGTNAPGALLPFSLDSEGDTVWLFSADAQTNLTGYSSGQSFGASPNPVALGRHVNSVEDEFFVLQSAHTAQATNASPRVGPVAITEIHYQPPYAGTNDLGAWEYLEVLNVSGATQPLYDPLFATNTWRLRGAVDFDFPAGAALAAGERGLVVGFDPVAGAAHLKSFRDTFGIPTNVPVWGPWSGQLANEGETIELKRPDPPNSNAVPYYVVETIGYRPSLPWPPGAAGGGRALHRLDVQAFADDPIHWCALPPSPGLAGDAELDSDGDGDPDWLEQLVGSGVLDGQSDFTLAIVRTNGPVWLSWPSASGKVFRVEASTNLAEGFTRTLAGAVTGTLFGAQAADTPADAGPWHYRVRLVHP